MTVLGDFLSPEAGQKRRAWLDEKLGAADEAMRYYLGPTGVPDKLKAVADALNYTDAGDMTAAADASRGFWESPSVGNAAELAAAGGALAIPFVGARMIDDGVDVLGDALRSGKDDIGRFAADEDGGVKLYRGTNNSGEKISGGIGEGYLFASPHEDVARLYGDTISEIELVDGARILREGTKDFSEVTGRRRGELIRTMRPGENIKTAADDAIKSAQAAGYDAVEFTSMRDMGTAILNKDAIKQSNLTPAQSQAQEILDMLKAGRGSEVTDDMMAAADDMYLYDNYDMPMDEASRMARAREMGFDTDAYHGTGYGGFDAFSSEESRVGGATYADIDPNVASVYARYGDTSQVYPVTMRADSPERFDLLSWDPQRETKAFDYARANGHDAYYATDGRRIAFDPTNIRSRFARFDPRLSHLRNLSAGVAGAAALGANDEDTNMMSILGMPSQSALRDYLK